MLFYVLCIIIKLGLNYKKNKQNKKQLNKNFQIDHCSYLNITNALTFVSNKQQLLTLMQCKCSFILRTGKRLQDYDKTCMISEFIIKLTINLQFKFKL